MVADNAGAHSTEKLEQSKGSVSSRHLNHGIHSLEFPLQNDAVCHAPECRNN